MNKPRVLLIGPTPPPYNGMSLATELVLHAVRDEVSVVHLDTADRRGLSNIGKIDTVNLLLASYHGVKYLWLLLLKRPAIVYVPIAQSTLPFLRDCLFLMPARILRKKVVVHLHGGSFAEFFRSTSATMQRIIRYALGTADRTIVLGSCLSNVFEGVIPRDRVRVVPNGIPDSFEAYMYRVPNGRRRTILFLSTLMREKGTLDVLRALPRVVKVVPDVRAVFAGEWFRVDDKSAAESMIRELGLESHVEFIGTVVPPVKYDVLNAADVFVLPTYNEGQPFAVLEAMSAGLPVISTKVGCIPETVINGVTGFILKPGDSEALADKLALLLTNQDLRREMGESSRKRFLDSYTQVEFSRRMRSIFKELS